MIDCYEPDGCCGAALSEALLSGSLAALDIWTHDDCGTEWKAGIVDGMRVWAPHIWVEVIR